MSDQPKPRKASPRGEPTTVEPYAERRQNVWPYSDKPTAGEWTPDYVAHLMDCVAPELKIARMHNAALVAATKSVAIGSNREKPTGEWTLKGCCIQVQDGAIICINDQVKADNLRNYHNAALAAERDRLEAKWKASMVDVTTALQGYEREEFEWKRKEQQYKDSVIELERQLAAEREKVQSLTEQMQRDFNRGLQ